MHLRSGLFFAAQLAWAGGGTAGFNDQLPDPTAVIGAVAVDAAGNTYLTGTTQSSTFPTTPGAFQAQFGGGQCAGYTGGFGIPVPPCTDAFIMKLDSSGAVVWATYLGGSGNDVGSAISVDAYGDVYVAGSTVYGGSSQNNFPVTAGSAFPSSTGSDGFLVKINPAGTQIIYGTYLPGINSGLNVAMAVDSNGNGYVAGSVNGVEHIFPTTAGAFQTSSSSLATGIVLKLNPTGSALVYATYLGGNKTEDGTSLQGIAVDPSGNAYVIGGLGAPTVKDFPVTAGAFQTVFSGVNAGFVTKLNAEGSGLVYSTFLGGPDAIKVDSQGRAYILGVALDFPTTPGAFESSEGTFLASLSADGSSLVYGTYVSGATVSGATALDVDAAGNAYVAGYAPAGFPVSAGPFEQCHSASAFAAEFSPAGALVDALVGAGYFGPFPTFDVTGMAVGQNGMVSIIGANGINGTYGQQGDFVANFLINNPLQRDGLCVSVPTRRFPDRSPRPRK